MWHLVSGGMEDEKISFFVLLIGKMECPFLSSSSLYSNPGACTHWDAKPYRLSLVLFSMRGKSLRCGTFSRRRTNQKKVFLVIILVIMQCSLMNIVHVVP